MACAAACALLLFLVLGAALTRDTRAREFTEEDMETIRTRIRSMFYHAYNSYLNHAFPYDELRPLTCDGQDTWGSFSLTLIDALDTLLVLGNRTEFQRVATLLQETMDFDIDVNASVFETNIRVVGGLLSAHLLSGQAGVDLEPGWPCSGPLLRMAEDAAKKLLPAFDTPSGMPYGTVNLLPGVGTFILEFATLSRLTGNTTYEDLARKALRALWETRSSIGLVGNHIDVVTQKWVAQDAGIGAGVDSYFEYWSKDLFSYRTQNCYTCFTSLIGDLESATRTFQNYYSVWRQFGGLPEFYSIPQGYTVDKREGYPLRPELIESAMYLFRATGDHLYLQMGLDALESIEKISRTPCGYASVKDLRDHQLDNRMESFFLAETIKYLYLLFDPPLSAWSGAWEEGVGLLEDVCLGQEPTSSILRPILLMLLLCIAAIAMTLTNRRSGTFSWHSLQPHLLASHKTHFSNVQFNRLVLDLRLRDKSSLKQLKHI
ncbi:hypothetical protein WMY93_027861 [Mugilogobius chulae]|uniref:alpha-1,2-Mannosidase n=1 Tax=Mugilogobius chulae TaxID=88201 RepID=A0AAW0MU74_9GOBI